MVLSNTRAVLHCIIKKFIFIKQFADVFCQIVLLILCAYNVYNNIGNLVRFIVYLSLLAMSLFWLIYTIRYYVDDYVTKEEKKTRKKTSLVLKIVRLVYRLALITYSIVEMCMFGYTALSLTFLISSICSYVTSILTTIISNQISFYTSTFEFAIEKDMAVVDNVKDVLEKIKHPLYGVSSMFVEEEKIVDKNEEKKTEILNKMRSDYFKEYYEKQEIKDNEKEKEKDLREQKRKDTINAFKNKINEKLKFKK